MAAAMAMVKKKPPAEGRGLKDQDLTPKIVARIRASGQGTAMKKLFALLLAMMPFAASANQLFVSPKGSDRGQCNSPKKPCATIGRACSVAATSADRQTSIKVAGGVYQHNTCNIYYHRLVGIFGNCNDRPDIVLSGNDVAFWAQDSAILIVKCVDIRSVGNGSIAFASRQFAIMDVDNIRIGELPGSGKVMEAGEISKINCTVGGITLYGSVGWVALARGMSTISLNCALQFENTPHVDAIVVAVERSLIHVDSASWVGAFTGPGYICVDSQITGATTMPGTGSPSADNCLVK